MAAPIKNQTCHSSSRWSTVLISHRTPVISERLSKSVGFIDSNQSIISSGMIFLWCLALTAFHISRQSPWYLQAPPLRPAPHTASRSYPEDYICHDDVILQVLATCSNLCLPGFLFLILFRRCYLLLYTQQQLASLSTDFIKQRVYELGHSCPYTDLDCQDCPQLNNCPMDAGTEEWFQLLVELDRRRSVK